MVFIDNEITRCLIGGGNSCKVELRKGEVDDRSGFGHAWRIG